MFSKVWTSAALLLALSLQANAHAIVSPALGVSGTPVRNDVKRPSAASPCGAGVNVASALDSSTAVTASAAGVVDATGTNFNAGEDGSRQFTAKVDASGTGTKFVAMTVTTNGDKAPTNVGSQPLVASLPAGTKCTGGASKDKCLVQFVSASGFGNCVAVTQAGGAVAAGGAAGGAVAAAGAAAGGAAAGGAAAGAAKKGKGKGKGKGKKAKGAKKQAKRSGTTAARALIAELEARGEEAVEVVKRSVATWVWA